jgi:hypothetical protein
MRQKFSIYFLCLWRFQGYVIFSINHVYHVNILESRETFFEDQDGGVDEESNVFGASARVVATGDWRDSGD